MRRHAALRYLVYPAAAPRPVAVVLLLVLVGALRLTPARSLDADRATARATPSSREIARDFPGSAYFVAHGAFGPPVATAGEPPVTTADLPRIISLGDRARALRCLTEAIYYEAGNEPDAGQQAVARVVLNRAGSGYWPASLCGAVYQGSDRSDRGCQFSFSCDGSMARSPAPAAWTRASLAARRALTDPRSSTVGDATYYHTLAVHPAWADRMLPVAVVGAHIFYRIPMQRLPDGRYRGGENARPGIYAYLRPPPFLPITPWIGMVVATAPIVAVKGSAKTPSMPGSAFDALPQTTVRPEYRDSGRIRDLSENSTDPR